MEQHKLNPGFKCEYCLFHFDTNNKDAYKAHVALHKVKPSNICVFCNKLLSDVRALKRHTKTHVSIIIMRFYCSISRGIVFRVCNPDGDAHVQPELFSSALENEAQCRLL